MLFNVSAFYRALDDRRRERSLSWSGVGREADLCPQALHRIQKDQMPRSDTLLKLMLWLGETDFAPYLNGPTSNER